MIVSQSFKTKNPDGTFGNEVALSTFSDLIFMSDKEGNGNKNVQNLTVRTQEIERQLAQEIQDRIKDVSDEESRAMAAEAAEKARAEAAEADLLKKINQEITDREGAIKDLNDSLTAKINAEVTTLNGALQTERSDRAAAISAHDTRIGTNEADIEALQGEITTLNSLIGTPETTLEKTILQILADFETRLIAIEEKILATEEPEEEPVV